MNNSFKISSRVIGSDVAPFIIAEMSGNHNHSLERALSIIEAAAKSGVHALKIQTYTPDTMTLDVQKEDFLIKDSKSLWNNTSLYKLYQQAYTPWEWHKLIIQRCNELGLICFSTPFDNTAVEFLEQLDVPCYKVASFENTDIPLIRTISSTKKPIIISSGMSTLEELDQTVNEIKKVGNNDIVLLKCTSAYPASPKNANLLTIPHLKQHFGCQVGLSDHTLGIGVALASVVLGATVIEKHFTLSRKDGGVDSAFSMEPDEMNSLVIETERAWQSMGNVFYGPTESEKNSIQFRRSLYIVKDLNAGDILTNENVRAIRPGLGLPPRYLDEILGRSVKITVSRGTALSWKIIS